LMSGTFAFAGPWSIGIASGIWSEFWSLYYNFLKNEK